VLLIAAILPDTELAELLDLVQRLRMTALVEVHDEDEVAQVLPLAPRVVGINNRNLHDFSVDLGTFGRLRALLPDHVVTVAESGVRDAHDVGRLAAMGADAVLVGEALVRAVDTAAKVRELIDPGGFSGHVQEYCGAHGQRGRVRFPDS
jgi:indole-3-glycerol phosphate synthase